MEIEFFDILSKNGPVSWSPNTVKTRLCLNYLAIPHKTTYLSYPDIAKNHKSLGIPPNPKGLEFTCPAIAVKQSSKVFALQESLAIAKFLDETNSSNSDRKIFPNPGALSLALLVQRVVDRILNSPVAKIAIPKVVDILDPSGREYFIRTRTEWFGMPIDDWAGDLEIAWKNLARDVDIFSKMLVEAANGPEGGPFFMGSVPSYADFVFVGYIVWLKEANEADGESNG
ncbi:hypothetical protein HK100_012795 [Physocladia obscura]|uniref:GST N-terminal domain-containing protein n=1 Tax=Physocladia obscura TaxID=109957 RepID=A0AAD5SZ99_9FUNG|nr:hypothetical protein HK100_012795 [Physocladia obscura]